MCFRESMSFLNSHYVHKGRGIPFLLIVRLFLKCLLEDKQFMDHNIWKDVNIDHAVQTDRKSCGVFMLKVFESIYGYL